jgi:hypothetical protein
LHLPAFCHICAVTDDISFANYTVQSTIFVGTWHIRELWLWTPIRRSRPKRNGKDNYF